MLNTTPYGNPSGLNVAEATPPTIAMLKMYLWSPKNHLRKFTHPTLRAPQSSLSHAVGDAAQNCLDRSACLDSRLTIGQCASVGELGEDEDFGSTDFRVRRSALRQSVEESEGFSVYVAIVDQIDWSLPDPWLTLLKRLNASQRVVVSVAQVHEHAAFNGLEETLAFHGPEVVRIAADSAVELGHPEMEEMLLAALGGSPGWPELETQWDATAAFEIEDFIEAHATEFFVDE